MKMFYHVIGNTTIEYMTKSGWIMGSLVTLIFSRDITVIHDKLSPPKDTLPFYLEDGDGGISPKLCFDFSS